MLHSPGLFLSDEIRKLFHKLGLSIGNCPLPFLLVPPILTVVSLLGLLRFHEENRIWYLYSPEQAPSHYEHAIANEFFQGKGGKFWLELPVTAKDTGNLLRSEYLEAVQKLADYLQFNMTVDCQLNTQFHCTFDDLCSENCNDNQILSIFSLIYRNESRRNHPNFRLTYPTMHFYNDRYYVGEHFSGVVVNPATNRIDAIRLIVLHFRTNRQNRTISLILDVWELKLLDFVAHFQHPLINVSVTSDGLISHEVRRNGLSCIPYFSLTILVIILFTLLTTFNFADWSDNDDIDSIGWVVPFGVASPLLAIGTSFCLILAAGLPFNSIVLVMPFLIIGIGVDDFFLIVHAWKLAGKETVEIPERLAATLRQAGPSMTITSLTNGLSFLVGTLTSTPAIRIFCIHTATAVLVDFLFQISFFCSVVVYIARLSKKSPTPVQNRPNFSTKVDVVSFYACLLNFRPVRLLIYCIFLLYLGTSIYGCSSIRVQLETERLVLADSPLHNIAWIYDHFLWKQGILVYVFVNEPSDLSLVENRRDILSMVADFESLPYSMGRTSTSLWLRSFLTHLTLFNTDINEDIPNFYGYLSDWLTDWNSGGGRWRTLLRYEQTNGSMIKLGKFIFGTGSAMGTDVSWETRGRMQADWRRLAGRYSRFNVTVFQCISLQTYSFYVDQLESMSFITSQSILVAFALMAVVGASLIPGASSVLSVTLAMLSINVGVFGHLSLWKVDLDPVSMCTILMSIGFSVDFVAHICYHFYRDGGFQSADSLETALRSIGWPMIQAGLSTLFGISPLLLIDSYMAYTFTKTVFLVVSFGLIHGLLFLPTMFVTLSYFSIKKTTENDVDLVSNRRLAIEEKNLSLLMTMSFSVTASSSYYRKKMPLSNTKSMIPMKDRISSINSTLNCKKMKKYIVRPMKSL